MDWARERQLPLSMFPDIPRNVEQDPQTVARAEAFVETMSVWQLAAFDLVAATTKSFIISLALMEGRLTVEQALSAARVDEHYQINTSGEIADVHGVDQLFVKLQLVSARNFFNLLRMP